MLRFARNDEKRTHNALSRCHCEATKWPVAVSTLPICHCEGLDVPKQSLSKAYKEATTRLLRFARNYNKTKCHCEGLYGLWQSLGLPCRHCEPLDEAKQSLSKACEEATTRLLRFARNDNKTKCHCEGLYGLWQSLGLPCRHCEPLDEAKQSLSKACEEVTTRLLRRLRSSQ